MTSAVGVRGALVRLIGRWLSLIGVAVLLLTASVSPASEILHFSDTSHNCDLCRFGQLPGFSPAADFEFTPAELCARFVPTGESSPGLRPIIAGEFPRGPPIL